MIAFGPILLGVSQLATITDAMAQMAAKTGVKPVWVVEAEQSGLEEVLAKEGFSLDGLPHELSFED